MKVLPELIKSVEFGGGGPKALAVILKIAAKLSNDDFETRIIPVIVKFFANPDRAIRVYLLDSLPFMIDRLPQKIVNDKLFPHIVREERERAFRYNVSCADGFPGNGIHGCPTRSA